MHRADSHISLKYHSYIALVRRSLEEAHPFEKHIAAGRFEKSGDCIKRRAFAGARRPEKGHEVSLLDIQRDIFDGADATKAFGNTLNREIGGTHESFLVLIRAAISMSAAVIATSKLETAAMTGERS